MFGEGKSHGLKSVEYSIIDWKIITIVVCVYKRDNKK